MHHGFAADDAPAQAGIRQGCPLSPLLFALAIEPLLGALEASEPDLLVCAYADDIAVAAANLMGMLTALAPIFASFGRASGFLLNLGKTVTLPLGSASVEDVQHWLRAQLGWGTAPVQLWAEYLGFLWARGRG